MNNKLLTVKDIPFENLNFWWTYFLNFRGYDEDRELNLNDVIEYELKIQPNLAGYGEWYDNFYPEGLEDEDGYYEHPYTAECSLFNKIKLKVVFHCWHTTFFLNNLYIGNIGGHFEAWFFTYDELKQLANSEIAFLLLLPMVGVTQNRFADLQKDVAGILKKFRFFKDNCNYIAKCMVNGLVINGSFEEDKRYGIISNVNHSVRNIGKYPRYQENVIQLNGILKMK